MSRLLFSLAKGSFFLGCLLFLSAELRAQGCCPLPGNCNPCSGGISVLTLRYHGFLPALVTVNDASIPALFNAWVNPGQTFTVTGRSAGSFAGNFAYFTLNGLVLNATIRVNCSLAFDPFTYFGLFTIVSAESKNGGVLCCSSNSGSVTPPEIFDCPGNVIVSTSTGCNAKATWTEPSAPSCDVVSLTSSHAPGSSFPVGVTQVTYTARNSANLTSTCSFTVTVTDTTRPTVRTATPDVVLNAGNDCTAVATWTAPQFTDNCSVASIVSTHTSGSVFAIGNTTVTYTAKDASGNLTNSKFTVTVKDITPPEVTGCPADITVQTTSGCTTTASWTPPKFTDACNTVAVTTSHNPGAVFSAGSNTVTYTAEDAAGNKTVCSFKVIVRDQNIPSFNSCPSDTLISTTGVGGVRFSWVPPLATDACSTPTLTSSHQPGDQFPVGTTTVTYTAKNEGGNTATCSFTVTVKQERSRLDVAQLVTPDGNAVNDAWIIGNIELYKENKVTIVDRWGSIVYSETGYDNENKVWRGRNSLGNAVPSGTYFYTITVRSGTENSETRGFIEVVR
jgi:gliding motility-associated-like protein